MGKIMEELKYRCSLRSPCGGIVEKVLTQGEIDLLETEGWFILSKALYDEKSH
jgi:hypothetical protein